MLLGADFLRAHRLLVAHSQRKIYFTYAGGTVFQETRALKGGSDPRAFKGMGAEGTTCSKDADCEGVLKCLSDRCARPN